MLNSIIICMRFKDAEAARKCCKVAAGSFKYSVIGCLSFQGHFTHEVYIKVETSHLYLAESDLAMLADFRHPNNYDFRIISSLFLPFPLALVLSWQS